MAVVQMAVFLVSSLLLLMAGSGHAQNVVSQADEDRAIDAIRQLIRNLERPPQAGQPRRVNNVCKIMYC
jgi:predicted neutral ceramidase superfamily lipid hydrolase